MNIKTFSIWVASIFIILFADSVKAEPVHIGAYVHSWKYMYKDGLDITQQQNLSSEQRTRWLMMIANLDKAKELNSNWNFIWVYQGADGPDGFKRVRRFIDEHKKRGLELALRIIEDCNIYATFTAIDDPRFGYSKEYYDWVRNIAEASKSDVRFYFVGNEVDMHQAANWNCKEKVFVSPEVYRKMLRTAYKAIKSVGSNLNVVESGITNYATATSVAYTIYKRDGLESAYTYFRDFAPKGHGNATSIKNFENFMKATERDPDKRYTYLNDYLSLPLDCDYYQIHLYWSWHGVKPILQNYRDRLSKFGKTPKFIASEVGYSFPPFWSFPEQEHANLTVKNIVTLMGEGIDYVMYYHLRNHVAAGVSTLYKPAVVPQVFVPWQAAHAFLFLCSTLQGAERQPGRIGVAGIREYRFHAAQTVSVVWAERDTDSVSVSLPSSVARVCDKLGRNLSNTSTITVTADPLYIFWK